jgi:hypothetical protein
MSATINSEQIVTKMIRNWAFTKGECLLGYPQHVDEIHSKDLPLMIINPPEMSIATSDFNRNTILTNSNWTFTAYNKHDTSFIPVTGGELVKNGVNWVGATGNIAPDDWTNISVPTTALGSEIIGATYKQTNLAVAGVTELGINQKVKLITGRNYVLEFNGLTGVAGSNIKLGTTAGSSDIGIFSAAIHTDVIFDFTALSDDCYITIETSPVIGSAFTELNTISIKESIINVELLKEWDNLENNVLQWFNNWWYEFVENGNDFVLTAPIQITRLKEASNDRLIGLKVTFSFNFYRFCNP